MGILNAIGDFLFGKNPDIFDKSGNVSHRLPKRTWDAWTNRVKMDPTYNWRNHRGTRIVSTAADKPSSPSTKGN